MTHLSVLREPGVTAYMLVRFTVALAVQIQTVAIGWFIYELTRDAFALGLVGLSQFLPALLLVLLTGQAADRFPRRAVMAAALTAMVVATASIVVSLAVGRRDIVVIFAALTLFGVARAFFNPAQQALLPSLVPASRLADVISVNVAVLKLGTVIGPLLGGLLYVLAPQAAFAAAIAAFLAALAALPVIPVATGPRPAASRNLGTLVAGFSYIASHKVLLGAITLDLFTVLLGGVTALLPVYAFDILRVGPAELGMMVAAPALGTILVALWLGARPLVTHAGRVLFVAVSLSGVAIVLFGLSTHLTLSLVALTLLGGIDMVSVYVRQTLVQLNTPDHVRGRVTAVNTVIVDASNELGAFRAGSFAALAGPVVAVVAGGAGVIVIAGLWLKLFPQLRAIQRLDQPTGGAAREAAGSAG